VASLSKELSKMSKHITRLDDARAMQAMCRSLTTKVIDPGMLPRCDKLIIDTIKAAGRFRESVFAFLEDQNEKTYSKLGSVFS
jgi:ABC-type enterochelin transport system substrate-binding protein